jgi:hypothetical protein
MKKIKLLLILLFLVIGCNQHISSQNKRDLEDMDLYLLIGQSNMAGRGKIENKNVGVEGIYSLTKDNEWIIATDPLHFDKKEAGVGPGLSFAKAIKEKNPDRKIGLIPCAVGGTSISKWFPRFFDSATNTYPYDNTIERLKIALKSGYLKGILWHQGESDSDEDKYKDYENRFDTLLYNLSKDMGISLDTIPVIIGELGGFLITKQKQVSVGGNKQSITSDCREAFKYILCEYRRLDGQRR